jgi:non-homologous end joining protein Ku
MARAIWSGVLTFGLVSVPGILVSRNVLRSTILRSCILRQIGERLSRTACSTVTLSGKGWSRSLPMIVLAPRWAS